MVLMTLLKTYVEMDNFYFHKATKVIKLIVAIEI
jgi:hypothetical protein